MKHLPRLLVGLASIVLLATAAFHATGHALVAREVAASGMAPFVKNTLPLLWLFFSWHLVAVALGAIAALLAQPATTKPVAIACSLVVAVDFGWVVSIAGLFAGSALLLVAAMLLLAGGLLLPRQSAARPVVAAELSVG
jgi:hypothetical protein